MSHLTKDGKPCVKADGHRGRHMAACCARPGCFAPRYKTPNYTDSYCWPHKQEANREAMQEYTSRSGPCGMRGCKRPRRQGPSGTYKTRCEIHETLKTTKQARRNAAQKVDELWDRN